jgi:Mg2+ and Co2+ transporter CorA
MRDTLAHASMLLAQIEGKLLRLERTKPNLAAKLADGLVDAFQDILALIQKEVVQETLN